MLSMPPPGRPAGRSAAGFGSANDPAVTNGVVYDTSGFTGAGSDRIFALNASTGAVLWQEAATLSCLVNVAVANGVVYGETRRVRRRPKASTSAASVLYPEPSRSNVKRRPRKGSADK